MELRNQGVFPLALQRVVKYPQTHQGINYQNLRTIQSQTHTQERTMRLSEYIEYLSLKKSCLVYE